MPLIYDTGDRSMCELQVSAEVVPHPCPDRGLADNEVMIEVSDREILAPDATATVRVPGHNGPEWFDVPLDALPAILHALTTSAERILTSAHARGRKIPQWEPAVDTAVGTA